MYPAGYTGSPQKMSSYINVLKNPNCCFAYAIFFSAASIVSFRLSSPTCSLPALVFIHLICISASQISSMVFLYICSINSVRISFSQSCNSFFVISLITLFLLRALYRNYFFTSFLHSLFIFRHVLFLIPLLSPRQCRPIPPPFSIIDTLPDNYTAHQQPRLSQFQNRPKDYTPVYVETYQQSLLIFETPHLRQVSVMPDN